MRTTKTNPVDWLFPSVRKQVLALLLMSPERAWHLREIARRTSCAVGTVRRELAGLKAAGLVLGSRDGNRTYYRANTDCPILPELRGLMVKTAGLADVVREALSRLSRGISLAFVYGSQASGEATAGSDVDLMVIGDVEELALHRAVARAEKKLGRAVNYTLMSPAEFRKLRRQRGGFLRRVLAGPKIAVAGSADEI